MKKRIILIVATVFTLVFLSLFFYSFKIWRFEKQSVIQKNQPHKMKQLSIRSSAFQNRGKIPSKYTCDGEDINPPLIFENIPDEARSLTLIVEDPDAPGKTWLHWVVFNISADTTHINEDSVPQHAVEAMTDFGHIGYGGPCPPQGVHRYHFKLYALDTMLDLTEDVTLEEIRQAMEHHILDEAELVGLYSRE